MADDIGIDQLFNDLLYLLPQLVPELEKLAAEDNSEGSHCLLSALPGLKMVNEELEQTRASASVSGFPPPLDTTTAIQELMHKLRTIANVAKEENTIPSERATPAKGKSEAENVDNESREEAIKAEIPVLMEIIKDLKITQDSLMIGLKTIAEATPSDPAKREEHEVEQQILASLSNEDLGKLLCKCGKLDPGFEVRKKYEDQVAQAIAKLHKARSKEE